MSFARIGDLLAACRFRLRLECGGKSVADAFVVYPEIRVTLLLTEAIRGHFLVLERTLFHIVVALVALGTCVVRGIVLLTHEHAITRCGNILFDGCERSLILRRHIPDVLPLAALGIHDLETGLR